MKIEILSHASMLISDEQVSIIIDPWLVGSAYWRSWWNYPASVFDENKLRNVDAVILTHIHWDHWHGVTLKRFFKDKHFIIPDEPGIRSEKDLRSMGISNISRLKHGETFSLQKIEIRLYQFGLYLNDSAVIVSNKHIKLLNANDAKIAGSSLDNLLKREGKIDFAFRSHSSANARACYKIRGREESLDDNLHYIRSFKLFMDKVKPKYAIPFASNHCHLHEESFKYNEIISNPYVLKEYLNKFDKKWLFEVMLPGSSWHELQGFLHTHSESIYHDLPTKLRIYQSEISKSLKHQTIKEDSVNIDARILGKFILMLPQLNKISNFYKRSFHIKLTFPVKEPAFYLLDMTKEKYNIEKKEIDVRMEGPVIIMPALIFRDAVLKNMFHHAAISKRCEFIGDNLEELKLLSFWLNALERKELIGLNGLDLAYLKRSFWAYLRRTPELLVYCKAFILLRIFKLPIYQVEELILTGKWYAKPNTRLSIIER